MGEVGSECIKLDGDLISAVRGKSRRSKSQGARAEESTSGEPNGPSQTLP